MRKHDVRKWLHAILDLLPVIIIPVFMIYSHRHTIDNYAIEVPQNEIVDFNQQIEHGNFDSLSGWHVINYPSNYTLLDNEVLILTSDSYNFCDIGRDVDCSAGKYVVKFKAKSNYASSVQVRIPASTTVWVPEVTTSFTQFHNLIDFNFDFDSFELLFVGSDNTFEVNLKEVQLFNLTQMFGVGNEPTLQEFEDIFTDEYYVYTLSKKILLKDVGTIIYNDTDIGSQMLYCLYNSVDKYFNLNNVFGFNNVYDWLSLNIFNGNPPIAIYIVWNIALYEFLMDLIMLLYALFMWFIDMCESLIDRSFHVASGRKK